jgi:tRNA(fMet)-specific endonuclease VapC
MQYLLDTSICVFYLRGKLNLADSIHEKGRQNFFISEITVAELRYGAEIATTPQRYTKR